MKRKIGLLVMAYGTPYEKADIEPYYTHIRGGRKPSAEALAELTANYEAIGGISPMANITKAQMHALEEELNTLQTDCTFHARLGLKHIAPFIEDGVAALKAEHVDEIMTIVLAPHYSTMSIKTYNERAEQAASEHGLKVKSIQDWYTSPDFIQFWAKSLQKQFQLMEKQERDNAVVIFSAHSLPEKILLDNDPYPAQLEATAKLIAKEAEIDTYVTGWQSEGKTEQKWLGPDVLDLTKALHKEKGYEAFVYAPVGFVSDHLEVLFDNDIECKEVCQQIGATYYRADMPNTDTQFIKSMANTIIAKLK